MSTIKQIVPSVFCGISALVLFAQCNSVDCPLDNTVVCSYGIYDRETGKPMKIAETDTLTITIPNRDTILLNRANGISSFTLPLSHQQKIDTLLFHFSNNRKERSIDTLIYHKENFSHFENISCPASIFHSLKKVQCLPWKGSRLSLRMDSVAISRSSVNYDDIENIRLYLRHH